MVYSSNNQQQRAAIIQSELIKNGYFHVKQALSPEEFQAISEGLGTIVGTEHVKLYVTKKKLHSPEEIEFHTDSILSDINCWQCEEPAEVGGSTNLLDTADLANYFSEHEINLMTAIKMDCPNKSHSHYYPKPFLTRVGSLNKIFYTPWFMHDNQELKPLQDKIAGYVTMKKALGPIAITLKKGECLFIDNKRMLHGRGELTRDTKRSLKRLWVATGPFDASLMA